MKKILTILLMVVIFIIGIKIGVNISNKNNEDTNDIEVSNDTKVISYLEEVDESIDDVDASTDEGKETLKDKVVNMVDFIFYDKEINGVKFNDLTEEGKEKVVEIFNDADSKVEEKYPGYKEDIKETVSDNYPKLIEKLNQGITVVDEALLDLIGEDYIEIKKNAKEESSNIIDKAKQYISESKEKVENWYEEWKNNK